MNLKNGYKVMYEVIESSERVFLASKSGLFADADEIARFEIGSYKVIYQRGDKVFGVDAEGVETSLDAFDAIFVEATEVEEEVEEPVAPEAEPEIPAETEKTEEPQEDKGEELPEEGNAE